MHDSFFDTHPRKTLANARQVETSFAIVAARGMPIFHASLHIAVPREVCQPFISFMNTFRAIFWTIVVTEVFKGLEVFGRKKLRKEQIPTFLTKVLRVWIGAVWTVFALEYGGHEHVSFVIGYVDYSWLVVHFSLLKVEKRHFLEHASVDDGCVWFSGDCRPIKVSKRQYLLQLPSCSVDLFCRFANHARDYFRRCWSETVRKNANRSFTAIDEISDSL